ncbi:hypothetical protein BC834DRAFT_244217 [Gloeopeniophorella convolvens]|nr:hypothetical protein BC834DRAFT_244217 [Gloeopeniophorella convolvens]
MNDGTEPRTHTSRTLTGNSIDRDPRMPDREPEYRSCGHRNCAVAGVRTLNSLWQRSFWCLTSFPALGDVPRSLSRTLWSVALSCSQYPSPCTWTRAIKCFTGCGSSSSQPRQATNAMDASPGNTALESMDLMGTILAGVAYGIVFSICTLSLCASGTSSAPKLVWRTFVPCWFLLLSTSSVALQIKWTLLAFVVHRQDGSPSQFIEENTDSWTYVMLNAL